jgi:hypothetical protein
MTTRSKNNIHKPTSKLTFHTHFPSTDIQEPTSVTNALKEPKWRHAMQDEFNALIHQACVVDKEWPHFICKLRKAIYGLK